MLPADISGKRILLSPLNWGMGHVTRCIPLIALLEKNSNEVIVAANAAQIEILKQYFPDLKFVLHDGYPFRFGGKGSFAWDLMNQMRPLWLFLRKERQIVAELVKKMKIDVLISDHRYGFYSSRIPSIFVTHQIHLPVRFLEWPAQLLHLLLMKKFKVVWVPDFDNNKIAGKLSRASSLLNVKYIGPLSRFSLYELTAVKQKRELVIVSGPMPYAQHFFNEQLIKRQSDTLFIVPREVEIAADSLLERSIKIASDWRAVDEDILTASKVYSRSGYSTLMDVYVLNCAAEFTPTPGQREQVYLADLWNQQSDDFSRIDVLNKEQTTLKK